MSKMMITWHDNKKKRKHVGASPERVRRPDIAKSKRPLAANFATKGLFLAPDGRHWISLRYDHSYCDLGVHRSDIDGAEAMYTIVHPGSLEVKCIARFNALHNRL